VRACGVRNRFYAPGLAALRAGQDLWVAGRVNNVLIAKPARRKTAITPSRDQAAQARFSTFIAFCVYQGVDKGRAEAVSRGFSVLLPRHRKTATPSRSRERRLKTRLTGIDAKMR